MLAREVAAAALLLHFRLGMYLCAEVGALLCGVVLGVRRHKATLQLLDGDVLHVEADIVSWECLRQGLVVHLHGLHLSGQG